MRARLETICLVLGAALLAMTAAFHLHTRVAERLWSLGLWDQRAAVIEGVLLAHAFVLCVLSLCSLLVFRQRQTTLVALAIDLLRQGGKELNATRGALAQSLSGTTSLVALFALLGIATALRCFFLTQPMRYDEAYTFLHFVNGEGFRPFFYPVPNNHVLHTLLVRLSVGLFGGDPVAIRLPALLAGLAVIPSAALLASTLSKSAHGLLTAAAVAAFPVVVLYDTMARGYSMAVLLAIWLALFGLRSVERPGPPLSMIMGVIAALGLYTMPSFLFPAAGVILWVSVLAMIRRSSVRLLLLDLWLPFGLTMAGLTLLLYTPVIVVSNGIRTIVANPFVRGLSWTGFFERAPAHLASTFADLTRDVPLILLVTWVALTVIAVVVSIRRREWVIVSSLPSLLVGGGVVLLIQHQLPPARTWLFFIPFLLAIAERGLTAVSSSIGPRSVRFTAGVMVLATAWAAMLLMRSDRISVYPDTGQFPEAELVAGVLARELTPRDALVAPIPLDEPLAYYLWRNGVHIPVQTSSRGIGGEREFMVVNKSVDLFEEPRNGFPRLLAVGNAEVYVKTVPIRR